MDTAKKQDLLSKKAEQYKTMDIAKKQDLLNIKKQNNTEQRMLLRSKNFLEKSKEECSSCTSKKTVDSCVEQFKRKIMEGPYYTCCVCNRTLHKKICPKIEHK